MGALQAKLIFINKWLKNSALHSKIGINASTDLIVGMDGFDTLATRNPTENLAKKFWKLTKGKNGIIFGGEKVCWPFSIVTVQESMVGKFFGGQMTRNSDLRKLGAKDVCEFIHKKASLVSGRDFMTYPYLNSGVFVGDLKSVQSNDKLFSLSKKSTNFRR